MYSLKMHTGLILSMCFDCLVFITLTSLKTRMLNVIFHLEPVSAPDCWESRGKDFHLNSRLTATVDSTLGITIDTEGSGVNQVGCFLWWGNIWARPSGALANDLTCQKARLATLTPSVVVPTALLTWSRGRRCQGRYSAWIWPKAPATWCQYCDW